ncbi:hypothetical protein WA026_015212 [Henosepilachna vigintioctopunctata]|uniref:Uncharacterized protein n=1 Tax=Henosepilachna vigintioctopunctata TaxID=420089 RepID=A0AAW1TV46_9CUCU
MTNCMRPRGSEKRSENFLTMKWFINTTDINIPQNIADFLLLGSKFGIPTTNKRVRLWQFLTDVENNVLEVPCEQRDVVGAQVTNSLTNYMNKSHKRSSHLCKMFRNMITFLRTNSELYILQADKGGCCVGMTRE